MKSLKNIITIAALFTAFIAMHSCQKLDRPVLGDYPKDANPPGGPLKFYAAMDGGNVDSIRANFGTSNSTSFVDGGASGKSAQFDAAQKGYINYPSANDFGASSDFSVSLWVNITQAQKNTTNPTCLLAFGNTANFWANITMFTETEPKSTTDSMTLKMHFNAVNNTDNWQAAGYAGDKRLPKMYDGQWHNITITYQAADSVFTLYRDGAQFDQMTMSPAIKFESPSQLVLGGFQQAAGVSGTYGDNPWMGGYGGLIDNVRLYGVTLSASEVQDIYNNKE